MARKLAELLAAGTAATVIGLVAGRFLPINKNLWTPSYAVLMAGLAAIALAGCVWIVDLSGARVARAAAAPFVWLGRNAIAAFTLSSLASTALIAIRVGGPDGSPRSLWTAIYRGVFDRFADPRLGSLLFALAYLAIWIAVFGVLYAKKDVRQGLRLTDSRRVETRRDPSVPTVARTPHTGPVAVRFRTRTCPFSIVSTPKCAATSTSVKARKVARPGIGKASVPRTSPSAATSSTSTEVGPVVRDSRIRLV